MNYERFKKPNKNIFLIDMTKEKQPFFSDFVISGIKKTLSKNGKTLFIVNKKGYSSGIICQDCGYIPKCRHCDISISYHQVGDSYIGLCNLCKEQYSVPKFCPKCQKNNIKQYGLGIQKVKEFLKYTFKQEVLTIDSKDVNSLNKISKTQKKITDHSLVVSTSILNHPFNEVSFDFCVILDADGGLQIPDFNSESKTFWMLYEIFQKYKTPNFAIQTKNPENIAIRCACSLDKQKFLEKDKSFRKINNYPPFQKICILLYKNEKEKSLTKKIDSVYQELLFLKQKYNFNLQIYKNPPLIYKKFDKFHYNILIKGDLLREFIDIVISKLNLLERGFKIDRDAQKLI